MRKSIPFRGEPLEYEVKGTGMPVMLIHGFTEDRSIWYPLLREMENKYKWILPDLRVAVYLHLINQFLN